MSNKPTVDTFAFNWQVYRLTKEGGEIEEVVALADHFDVASAAFEAAIRAKSHAVLQLRNCSRVVRTAATGAYDGEKVEVLWRKD